jgi:phosphoribosyl 1,2-cyclic phosphodiesterase
LKATLWGTRGSLASPGPDTIRYGGNTSCVSVQGSDGTLLVLDAGTGIRVLGQSLSPDLKQVHILLSHLHMDHVQGLPFFEPLRQPGVEVHIWGPASTPADLEERLIRYLSPPLFPVRVRDLLSRPYFHALGYSTVEINELLVSAQMVIHPNPTVGYRIQDSKTTLAYLPDHEPALSTTHFPREPEWTSGYSLAKEVDLLIHDAQYTSQEYEARVGYGHSSVKDALRFARLAGVKQIAPFHHDPAHSDDLLDQVILRATSEINPSFQVTPGREGVTFDLA